MHVVTTSVRYIIDNKNINIYKKVKKTWIRKNKTKLKKNPTKHHFKIMGLCLGGKNGLLVVYLFQSENRDLR